MSHAGSAAVYEVELKERQAGHTRPQVLGRRYGELADEPEGACATPSCSPEGGQPRLVAPRKKVRLRPRTVSGTARVLVKVGGIGLMLIVLGIAVANWPPWVIEEEDARTQILTSMFVVGLFVVALEDFLDVNKSSVMLIMAATMWAFLAVGYHPTKSEAGSQLLHEELNKGIQDVGSVILFLLPAMGVVESIDHFDGFSVVTLAIHRVMDGKRERLIPIISILTFFLSSVIDNLTSTIVALKILRHVSAQDPEFRKMCGGLAVIAANAGGAWSPIGDVTTTMLWIQGKITAPSTVSWLLLPSACAGIVPMLGVWWRVAHAQQEEAASPTMVSKATDVEVAEPTWAKAAALALGVACILLVPVLKIVTGLPPYLGMLLALGLYWLITDTALAHPVLFDCPVHDAGAENGDGDASPGPAEGQVPSGPPRAGVVEALHKVDLTGLLFFAGVLLAVGALDSAGVLHRYANGLMWLCKDSVVLLCSLLGVSSAIVDNVPLVEAAIDMFAEVSRDDPLWQLVALAAGTGGSLLSIGSIAGVTLMSMEDVGFLWYCKQISPWAALGLGLGIIAYQVERLCLG